MTVSASNRTILKGPANYFGGPASALRPTGGLLFPYQPDITYAQSVNYSSYDLTHTNYTYHAYAGTPSPSFQVTGQFATTTAEEHEYTLGAIHFLRSVSKMYYGLKDIGSSPSAGTPPPLLRFSSYGNEVISNIPVFLGSFTCVFDSTTDLIEFEGVALPAVMTFALDLLVSVNPSKQKTEYSTHEFISGNAYGQGFI